MIRKPELVEKLAVKMEITKKEADTFLNHFIDCVTEELMKQETVDIRSFCKFEVVRQAERQGRNPQTGEVRTVPAKWNIKGRISPLLKRQINE